MAIMITKQRSFLGRMERRAELAPQAMILQREELRRVASRDGLTGLYNRRAFDEMLSREFSAMHRRIHQNEAGRQKRQEAISLIMFDLDHFKKKNDLYGHQMGDFILREVGEILRKEGFLRGSDIGARYGGEEFAIILPATDNEGEGGVRVAEKIRQKIEEQVGKKVRERILQENARGGSHPIPKEGTGGIKVSASFGVSFFTSKQLFNIEEELKGLINRADQALYHVKGKSRNAVALFTPAGIKTGFDNG